MAEFIPTKKEIVKLVDAQANTIDSISERLVKIENSVDKQESKNQNIIIGVVVAFIFIIGTVAAEVMLSNTNDSQFYSGLEKDVYNQGLQTQNLNNRLDNIKILNPYLK